MSEFRAFTHVERFDKDKIKAIKHAPIVSVQPKIDGSNGCIYADDNGVIHCGSRTREVGMTKETDNQGFCQYMMWSEDTATLRDFCLQHKNYIVYGEWLGQSRCLGSIKRYLERGFWVFDIFKTDTNSYMPHEAVTSLLDGVYDKVVPEFYHGPASALTEDLVNRLLESNHFNLPSEVTGEGIVIKPEPSIPDAYGNPMMAKVVRDEFKGSKARPKRKYAADEIATQFVDECCTAAFMDKCRNKVCLALGLDEFDTNNSKAVGYMMCLAVDNLMHEEFWDFFKKRKICVDLGAIDKLVKSRVRKFLGL